MLLFGLVRVIAVEERVAFWRNDVERVKLGEFRLVGGAFEWACIAWQRFDRFRQSSRQAIVT